MNPRDPSSSGADAERASREAVAVDWLIAHDAGLTPERQREFERWLAADPQHAVVWSEVQRAWTRLDRLPELPHFAVVPRSERRRRFRPAWAVAAAAVLAAGIFFWPESQPASPGSPVGIVRMAPNVFVFPDGSRAELNEGSQVAEHFTAAERRVRLVRGEAHFSVMKDASRPFVVEAAGVAVRALGTAFNVRLEPTGVEVLVTQGHVAVEAPAHAGATEVVAPNGTPREPGRLLPDLQAGQRAVVDLTSPALPPQVVAVSPGDMARSLAWQGPRLRFSDVSLEQVAAEFNRQNRAKLIVEGSAANILVSGTFRADNVDVFVRFLEAGFHVVAERRSDGSMILRRAP